MCVCLCVCVCVCALIIRVVLTEVVLSLFKRGKAFFRCRVSVNEDVVCHCGGVFLLTEHSDVNQPVSVQMSPLSRVGVAYPMFYTQIITTP